MWTCISGGHILSTTITVTVIITTENFIRMNSLQGALTILHLNPHNNSVQGQRSKGLDNRSLIPSLAEQSLTEYLFFAQPRVTGTKAQGLPRQVL